MTSLGAVDHLVEQLWAPVLASGDIRIRAGGSRSHQGWRDIERYRALPTLAAATMLLPTANRSVLSGSLLNFRGLRSGGPRLQRALLGNAARAGLHLPFPTVALQTRVPDDRRPMLPTERVAADLGLARVHASLGVRTGANRKTTLQLVDDTGAPVGFAKFAWDRASTEAVEREATVLDQLDGGTALMRTPRLLARGSWHGRPYLVSAPLPPSSRRPDPDDLPTAQEFFALCPVERLDTVGRTGQFQALRDRVAALQAAGVEPRLLTSVADLLAAIASVEVPVSSRWHGDLTAWNCARDGQGRLWCWDWESTEPDATAGLDAIHWTATSQTLRGGRYDGTLLAISLDRALPVLTAVGHRDGTRAVVPALYAATLVERAVALTVDNGGWDDGWLRRDEAVDLVAAARSMAPARQESRVHDR